MLELGVGLASGTAVGGVIGRHRILFDLWGDTVNMAQRMETTGIPGCIQVSEATMRRTSDLYQYEQRTVEVKGLGSLSAHLLIDPGADMGSR
jgi:class 3 adenylate cyclase